MITHRDDSPAALRNPGGGRARALWVAMSERGPLRHPYLVTAGDRCISRFIPPQHECYLTPATPSCTTSAAG